MYLKVFTIIFILVFGFSEATKADECKAYFMEYKQAAKIILADSEKTAAIVENVRLKKRASVDFYCNATKKLPTALEASFRALSGLENLHKISVNIQNSCPIKISDKVSNGIRHLTGFLEEENKRVQALDSRRQELCN